MPSGKWRPFCPIMEKVPSKVLVEYQNYSKSILTPFPDVNGLWKWPNMGVWLAFMSFESCNITPHDSPKKAMILGSTSIRHRSDIFVSGRCLIDVDPKVFGVWEISMWCHIIILEYYGKWAYQWNVCKSLRNFSTSTNYSCMCRFGMIVIFYFCIF